MAGISSAEAIAKVSSIFIYPVKSCRGISVLQAPLTPTDADEVQSGLRNFYEALIILFPFYADNKDVDLPLYLYGLLSNIKGFRWDRQWLVVNSNGRAYTQRVVPKLALVEVELPSEAFLEGWEPTEDSYMVLKAPGMQALKICLNKPYEVANGVSVWEWSGSALDEGAEASKWFSDYIGKTSRLVRFNTASEVRVVDPNYASGHNTMFSDGYPFLLLSQESMDELNKLLKEPIPVNRFRPNILVEGHEPFSEDLWTEIKISKFSFQGVKLCSRCKVPSINQDTGIAGAEPNETLKIIRSDKVLRPNLKQQGRIYFGHNMVWKDYFIEGNGKMLKVGDPVYVLQKVSSAAEAAA